VYNAQTASGFVLFVRWRTVVPGSGYQLWDGMGWTPISDAEYRSYIRDGFAVHMNPAHDPA